MRRIKRVALAAGVGLAALGLLGTPFAGASAQSVPTMTERAMKDAPYWNPALPVEQRVEDLLARMTLEEKVAQILTIWCRFPLRFDPGFSSRSDPGCW